MDKYKLYEYYSSVQPHKVEWLWYPYIPYGKLTILQGDPGDGKSTFILNVAALLTNGKEMPDGSATAAPQTVIYQCSEDNLSDTIRPRPEEAGADCNRIAYTDISPNLTKEILHDGYLPEQGFVPDLSDFDLGDGPVASAAKRLSRSRAIYYDEMMDQSAGNISVQEMGDKKYDPEFIQRLIQKGLKPLEGWSYLRGMATIHEKSFSIYPASWADSFGTQIYKRDACRLMLRVEQINAAERKMPYGWTIGLDLPTKETVEETIEYLKAKMA